MPFSIIPFLLLAIPLAEIAAFVIVGSQIGVLPTLALVLVTAIAGSILLRVQGFGVVNRIRRTLDEGGVPGRDLVHGAMILVAGVLLLTPGFITDTLGFLLFIPAVRAAGWAFLRNRVIIAGGHAGAGRAYRPGTASRTGPRTIDLSTDDYKPGDDTSPWSRSNGE